MQSTAEAEAALLEVNLEREALNAELAKTASHPRSGAARRRKADAEARLTQLDQTASALRLQIRRLGA